MTNSIAFSSTPGYRRLPHPRIFLAAMALILLGAVLSFAQISVSPVDNVVTVDDAPDMEVFAYGKSVVIKQSAKGVLAFGGDVIVEGRVSGDVATIGGSVIQKEGAYIGGDVIIFGGKYLPDSSRPLREEGKQTLMYA